MDQTLQKTIKGAVGALTLFIMLGAVLAVLRIAEHFNVTHADETNTITVTGDAEVFAKPDIATISFSARAENADLVKAQEEAEKQISAAIEAVKAAGVDEKDIQTTYYNASPRYEWNQKCGQYGCDSGDRVLVGYEVNESVSIKVRDLTKASAIIGVVGAAKVSDIQGPNFDIEDREGLIADAREEAIKEAKEKAKTLANELGVNLGKIVSFNDGGNGYPMPMYAKAEMDMVANESSAGRSVAPTLAEGQNRIYSSVSITYRVK